jgi:hypothetical protein
MLHLRISNNDIRSKLARRLQDCERKQIGNKDSRNFSSLSFENNHVRFSHKEVFTYTFIALQPDNTVL